VPKTPRNSALFDQLTVPHGRGDCLRGAKFRDTGLQSLLRKSDGPPLT
jgi:hypothetical protein